jgi:uncharacterized membrane protein AbrB (regulator of aidB expression)
MVVAAVFALSGSSFTLGASQPVVLVAFALVGLLAACAALGIALASAAGVSRLDGYLATTPGGLSAVLAVSVGSKTDTTFVLSVQIIRTFVMLLAAPPLARWIARRWKRVPGAEAAS